MKILFIVTCLFIPLYAGSLHKRDTSDHVRKTTFVVEKEPEMTADNTPATEIDVNNYRGPFQNIKSNIPAKATLKKEFNGITYEILTSTENGIRDYLTLEYDESVEACKISQPKPRTLLTFQSAKENNFVAKWLFKELKIVTQVWIGLTRINATNDFIWADGTTLPKKNEEKLFKNWHKCEPNDITTTSWAVDEWGENCVEMYSAYYPYPLRCDEAARAGQWNDIPCRKIYNMVVCQETDHDYKLDTSVEMDEMNLIEEGPIEVPVNIIPTTSVDVNDDNQVPFQNILSNIPDHEKLKKEFNGISYEILISTDDGIRNYATLEHEEAVEACNKLQPERKTLLTFKSAEENAFVANWLFDELKIANKVWIGLTRVNGTNDFIWTDGATLTSKNEGKLFKNWHKCEPNDITTSWGVVDWGENCVEMYSAIYPYPIICDEAAKAGQWNDIPCQQIYNLVVCQGKLT